MENKWRGVQLRAEICKRKTVLWFRRLLCACPGCLGTCVPSVRVWVYAAGAWEVLGGGRGRVPCAQRYGGILSEVQRALRSAPSLPCAMKKKILKCHIPKSTTLYLKFFFFLRFNQRETGINI